MGYCNLSFCFDPMCSHINPSVGKYPARVYVNGKKINLSGPESRLLAKLAETNGTKIEEEVEKLFPKKY